jgi:Cupin superfamily protein
MEEDTPRITQTTDKDDKEEESISLDYLFQSKVNEFFDEVWQKSCAIFRLPDLVGDPPNGDPSTLPGASGRQYYDPTVAAAALLNPLRYLVSSGLAVTEHLLEQQQPPQQQRPPAPPGDDGRPDDEEESSHIEPPLIFQNQSIVSYEDVIVPKYDGCLWAALLDGCSVVFNHADAVSPWIASLCNDLQKSVPHAYANVYITPAFQQAVDAHADDRDVFIIQLYGVKQWTVYQNVPIPLPYSNEQVGKDGLVVPDDVLHGPVLIQTTLQPGDVLYLPRGYVHQATSGPMVSCHVTVALATHDWTMAGLLEQTGHHVWRNHHHMPLRAALPRAVGRRPLTAAQREFLSAQVDTAVELLRNELSVVAMEAAMRQKYDRHNRRAALRRDALLMPPQVQPAVVVVPPPAEAFPTVTTGPRAAPRVSLHSYLRVSSEEEKAAVVRTRPAGMPVGLHVQQDIYDEAIRLVGVLKENGGKLQLRDIDTTLCFMTRLALAKRCVSLGALAIANPDATEE